jgi:hypothetical protein
MQMATTKAKPIGALSRGIFLAYTERFSFKERALFGGLVVILLLL